MSAYTLFDIHLILGIDPSFISKIRVIYIIQTYLRCLCGNSDDSCGGVVVAYGLHHTTYMFSAAAYYDVVERVQFIVE